MVVIGRYFSIYHRGMNLRTQFNGLHLFRFQVWVGSIALQLIIHLREGGQTEGGVVGCKEFDIAYRIAHIQPWVNGHIHVAP